MLGKDLFEKLSLPYVMKSNAEFNELGDNEISQNYKSNV